MAWRSGSVSRSLISTARASLRPAAPSPLPRIRPPPLAAPRVQSRRFSIPASREEWKRWVMRKDIDHPMAREECCIVREEAVGFA